MRPEGLEDLYRLSPLQDGMLFESLLAPGSGVYINQVSCTLVGPLDMGALRRAWEQVVERHGVLRTSFHWHELEHPLQMVHRRVEVPWREEDWRGLEERRQATRWAEHLAADRSRGFDLEAAPLMRLALFRTAEHSWRFLWTHHHLLLDGWSQPLVLREVFALYRAACRGEASPLPRPRPYRELVEWLRRRDRQQVEAFWRRELAGVEVPTALGVGRPAAAPGGEEVEPGKADLELTTELTAALGDLARGCHLTLSTWVHGAWGLLLSRYSGERDVVFGTVVAGRPSELEGVESRVGPFINTLPLRLRLAAEEGLLPWLGRLQDQQMDLQRHAACSLIEIQGWGGVPRGRPLFESLLVFENYPVDSAFTTGVEGVELRDLDSREQGRVPLTLLAVPGERLHLAAAWQADRFEAEAVEDLLGRWAGLLERMVASPEASLAELGRPSAADERWLASREHRRGHGLARGSVRERIVQQARRRPEAPAVAWGNGREDRLSYGELEIRARHLARRLMAAGARPEVPVAVLTERPEEAVVGFVAVLGTGAAYLPLDPALPAARLAWMLADAAAGANRSPLLLVGETGTELPELPAGTRVLELRQSDPPPAAGAGPAPRVPPCPASPAYLIYTSGSTGIPKGVAVPYRDLAEHVETAIRELALGPGESLLSAHAPGFDVTVEHTAAALASGACLLPRGSELLSPAQMLRRLASSGATLAGFPTAYWRLLVAELATTERRLEAPALGRVVVGGEAMPPEAVGPWRRAAGDRVRLVNAYGPTEAVVAATLHEVSAAEAQAPAVPLGRPLPGRIARVLDRWGNRCPPGMLGELCLGGLLARGYPGRPALTAERFVPDPWSPEPGARLYRTGDRVRWLPDGRLEFLGRRDHQLKVRGYRVEPGEVEAALAADPGVRQAVVVGWPPPPAAPDRLVAYVAAGSGEGRTPEDLTAALRGWLPAHMVPGEIVVLDALPLTANGKVDRRALPAPSGGGAPGAFQAPRTPLEERLATLWAELLGRERVGVNDDFFALGGHSLLAMQMTSRLREALGVELPLRRLFESPTIAALARELEPALGSEAAVEPQGPPLLPVPRDRELPLSFGQERLWFLHQLDPLSPAYNVPSSVALGGELTVAALEQTLSEIVRRHEALRTHFPAPEGRPVQAFEPARARALPVVDLSGLAPLDKDRAAAGLRRRQAERAFDLARGPLLRAHLLRLGAEEHHFLLTVHHAACDEWSLAVLLRELAALYPALLGGAPSPLAEPAVQVADYAVWQRQRLDGELLDAQLDWWQRRLAGAPPLVPLPSDRPRPRAASSRGGRVPLEVPGAVAEGLATLGQERGATLFMVLLAAFTAQLVRYGAGDDLVVGTPVAHRTHPALEGLVGFFVNTLALRLDAGGDPSFEELVARAREVSLEAFAHQDLPFEKLVEHLQPDRSLGHAPLLQVMLALHNVPRPALEAGGLTLEPLPAEPAGAKLDLLLELEQGPSTIRGFLEFNADLFDRTTAERLGGHLGRLLAGAVAEPWRPVSELPLLGPEERHQVLGEWGGAGAGYPQACLHELFEAQASLRPEAVAVVAAGERLTYADLDRRANHLAHRLRRLGVGPEVVVGLWLDRSELLVVAVLGILKAGGAYLPIDPTTPPERGLRLLADAGAAVVVTDAGCSEAVAAAEVPTVRLERGSGTLTAGIFDQRPRAPIAPSHLAYVIYTSGSTGRPKGVQVPHGRATRLLASCQADFGFGPGDTWTLFHSFAFDFSVWELWGALAHGGRLVVVPREVSRSPEAFYDLLEAEGVTVLNQTPSAFRQLAAEDERRGGGGGLRLRWVIFGGEALEPGSLEGWIRRHGSMPRLVNMYGITETTVHVTLRPLGAGDLATPWRSPLGRPLGDLSTRVLGRGGQPVPVGVPGELCVGGAGVSRGYLGRPALTAERFVPDPFAAEAGMRLYRSGDRARWLPGGELEYLGRLDHQVKLRGFRIEPGEIEAALLEHPTVREAVVLLRDDPPAGPLLVAYVVAVQEPAAAGDLLAFLRERLPDPMVPGRIVTLDALPLTANGKVDRRALPAPEGARPELERPYIEPRTALEKVLAQAWAEALGVDRVGIHDSFFDLGGHSLLATRMISWVREVLEEEVPLKALFERPTVAGLAAALSESPESRGRIEATAELLLEVGELSEDEVTARLEDRELEGEGPR